MLRLKKTCTLSWAIRDYRSRGKRARQQVMPECIALLCQTARRGRVTRGARASVFLATGMNTTVKQSWRDRSPAIAK